MGISESEFAQLQANIARGMGIPVQTAGKGPDKGYTASKDRYRSNWERCYAQELENQKKVAEILEWKYEPIKLRLADGAYYVPDFLVAKHRYFLDEEVRLEFHEVKGFWREKALVKFKVAAELFPWFRFLAIRKKKVKEGGGWEIIKDLNA